jgi:hypothetical protein
VTSVGSFTLEWRGTRERPPILLETPTGPGDVATVKLLGATMRLRFADYAPIRDPRPTVTVTQPDPATLRLTWSGALPAATAANGVNAEPTVMLAFALHLEDRLGALDALATLEPPAITLGSDSWADATWASPDGMLRSRFTTARDTVSVIQWIDGLPIAPAPLTAPGASCAGSGVPLDPPGVDLGCVNGSQDIPSPRAFPAISSRPPSAPAAAQSATFRLTHQSIRSVIRHGLRLRLTLGGPCPCVANVAVFARHVSFGSGSRTRFALLARRTSRLPSGISPITIRLSKRHKGWLRGRRAVRLKVILTMRSGTGIPAPVTRYITLRQPG